MLVLELAFYPEDAFYGLRPTVNGGSVLMPGGVNGYFNLNFLHLEFCH